MDSALPRLTRARSPATVWSLCAGGYALLCSLLVLVSLSFITDVVVQLLPGPDFSLLFAVPVPILGTVVWWAVVERRASESYVSGALAGALTGGTTVLVWLAVFLTVWSPQLLVAGGILVAFVLAVVVPAGALAALPLALLRRRRRRKA